MQLERSERDSSRCHDIASQLRISAQVMMERKKNRMSPVTSNCGVPLYNHIIYLSLAEASQAIGRRMSSSDIRSIMASNGSRSQDITTCGLRSNYVDEQVKLSV